MRERGRMWKGLREMEGVDGKDQGEKEPEEGWAGGLKEEMRDRYEGTG